MSREPVAGETADLFQSSRFLEEVGRARNDVNTAFTCHTSTRLPVQDKNDRILAADDHQGRRSDPFQRLTGKVRPAAAEDDGAHSGRVRRRGQCGGATCAGTEEAHGEGGDLPLTSGPIHRGPHPLGEQWNVEAQLGRSAVKSIFRRSEQVEEERAQTRSVKLCRDGTVARAVPAASTAVGEDHQATCPLGSGQRARNSCLPDLNRDVPALGCSHDHTAWGNVSGTSPRSQRAVRSRGSTARVSSM